MGYLSFILWLSLIGTPVSAGCAWWLWSRRNRSASRSWRASLLIMGLLTASANAFIYYSWLLYRTIAGSTPQVWTLKEIFGNISIWLVPMALVGAMGGKGGARIPIAVCALLGLMNWVPVAIL
jgi:hypothetical protein